MPKNQLSLKEKLEQFDIYESEYNEAKENLTRLGYSPNQINKLILRDFYFQPYRTLLEVHKDLIGCFRPHQLIKAAAHPGGAYNLIALKDYKDALLKLYFDPEQIVAMVSHHGGAFILEAVCEHGQALKNLGFKTEDIRRMVNRNGSAPALKAIIDHYETLHHLKFTNFEIVRIVSTYCGSENIQALALHYQKLTELGFSKQKIFNMARFAGGFKTIDILINFGDMILKYINHDEIVEQTSQPQGWKNLLINDDIANYMHKDSHQSQIYVVDKPHDHNGMDELVSLKKRKNICEDNTSIKRPKSAAVVTTTTTSTVSSEEASTIQNPVVETPVFQTEELNERYSKTILVYQPENYNIPNVRMSELDRFHQLLFSPVDAPKKETQDMIDFLWRP